MKVIDAVLKRLKRNRAMTYGLYKCHNINNLKLYISCLIIFITFVNLISYNVTSRCSLS